MTRDVRKVLGTLIERRPGMRRALRFTFHLHLTTRTDDGEMWEINLWEQRCRRSRLKHPPVEIAIPRSHFWALVEHSSRRLWRNAHENGHIVFRGDRRKAARLQSAFQRTTR